MRTTLLSTQDASCPPARLSQLSHKCGPVSNRRLSHAVSTGPIRLLAEPRRSLPAELCVSRLIISFVHLLSFLRGCHSGRRPPLPPRVFRLSVHVIFPERCPRPCDPLRRGARPSPRPRSSSPGLRPPRSTAALWWRTRPPVPRRQTWGSPSENVLFRPLSRDGGRFGIPAGVEVAFLQPWSQGCRGKEQRRLGLRSFPSDLVLSSSFSLWKHRRDTPSPGLKCHSNVPCCKSLSSTLLVTGP